MRPRSLTQALYDQTQQRFSEQLHFQAAPSAIHSSSNASQLHQQRSRKRKATGSMSLLEHSSSTNNGAFQFQFPLRVLQSSPPQATALSSSSIPSQSSSLSTMYNRTQPRATTQSPSFPWNQQLQPLATSSQVVVAVANDQQPPLAQQRERTSRYLSEGDRRTIISRIEHGEKQVTLAKEYSVSRAAICNLYKNRKEVLTRVDRDPEAKHPKKQRPKKVPVEAMLGDESPPAHATATVASPLSSPADEDGDLGDAEDDEAEEKVAVKPEQKGEYQQQKEQRVGCATSTTTATTSTTMQVERTLVTEDFSGPMETVLLPHSSSYSSLSSPSHSATPSSVRESPQSSSSLEQHRRIKPFLVHDASVYSLPTKKLLSSLRNAETRGAVFRHHADRVMRLLVEEAIGCLPQRETDILTPYGDAIPGIIPTDERAVCAISMEAVIGQEPPVLLRAFADIQPMSSTGVLTLTAVHPTGGDADRHEERDTDWQVHARLPPVHRDQVVLLLDLFCGTGERACSALGYLVREARIAPSSIYFVTMNGAVPGLQRVHHYFPDVSLITAQMDKVVDAQRRIRPGVGNFLERYWSASHYQQQQQHMDAHRYLHHQR